MVNNPLYSSLGKGDTGGFDRITMPIDDTRYTSWRVAKPFNDRRSFKGIYFVRLETDGFKQIEKAILLR